MSTDQKQRVRVAGPKGMRLRFHPKSPLDDRLFWNLCRANPDMRLERTSQGELILMTPAGTESGGRNAELSGQLYVWSKASGLGRAFDSSTGYTLRNGAIRAPDASWIDQDRLDAMFPEELERFAHICPDFVAELRSRTDSLRVVREKMAEYRSQGARLGWLIDPKRKVVEIFRPRRRVERLSKPTTLSGEDVLPGFVLDLKGILTP